MRREVAIKKATETAEKRAQGNCKAAGGGRGLKAKTSCNEEASKGGECSGRAQWNAGTWTLVSQVLTNFDFADFFFLKLCLVR